MASLSFPPLVPPVPVVPRLQVEAVTAVAPAALLQAELDAAQLPLPSAQPASTLPQAADGMPDSAAMRPDQVVMARQLSWPSPDSGALASSWRGMVRGYGNQLARSELQARPGQLPANLLLAGQLGGQDPHILRQADLQTAADAWRFTVHAGGPQAQHLRVVQEEGQQEGRQQRRRTRAALRLELVLADGTVVTVQAEPLADGVRLELCAPDASTVERLKAIQPELEAAVGRAGLRVLGWKYRDSLPLGRVHARLPSTEAASALSLPVFRAIAELALLLPAERA
jgi:hypothetical protein